MRRNQEVGQLHAGMQLVMMGNSPDGLSRAWISTWKHRQDMNELKATWSSGQIEPTRN